MLSGSDTSLKFCREPIPFRQIEILISRTHSGRHDAAVFPQKHHLQLQLTPQNNGATTVNLYRIPAVYHRLIEIFIKVYTNINTVI